MRQYLPLVMALAVMSCGNENNHARETSNELLPPPPKNRTSKDYHNDSGVSEENETQGFSDGLYCASIEYYNPNTGTQATYVLPVEVEGNELTVIYWPNGGWLDQSHFCCAELDDYGTTSFQSDEGYEYQVTIQESGGCRSINYEEEQQDEYSEEYGEYKGDDEEESEYDDSGYDDY
jgi:hypothetical protein